MTSAGGAARRAPRVGAAVARRLSAFGLLAAASVLTVQPAAAQENDPDTSIQFSLSPPGARSLALGGAFLAMADDATAAYTNPAGLTNLTLGGPEVAVELRHNGFVNSFVDRGHFSDTPGVEAFITNQGLDVEGPGVFREEADSETDGISFLSFAYVLPRGVTLALYRHELARFQTEFRTQGPFLDTEEFLFRFLPKHSETDLEIVNYGVSGAFELAVPFAGRESALSLGLGLSYYELDLFVRNRRYDLDRFFENIDNASINDLRFRLPGNFNGPGDYRPDNLASNKQEIGDDDAFGYSLGFLWKFGSRARWRVGGVFRKGPDFETRRAESKCFQVPVFADDDLLSIECEPGPGPAPDFAGRGVTPGVFTVPDVLGLGGAFSGEGGKTKITFDVNRVRYAQRLGDFTSLLEPVDSPDFDPEFDLDPADVRIRDADQLHLGLERIVWVVESLFVGTARFGAWLEPFHELEYTGDSEIFGAFIRRQEDDELHLSAGFGLVIEEDYQIDLAVDLSDVGNTFSVSLVKFL